ncbi:hypothetical protein ACLOJK_009110 [Asimina triloba]
MKVRASERAREGERCSRQADSFGMQRQALVRLQNLTRGKRRYSFLDKEEGRDSQEMGVEPLAIKMEGCVIGRGMTCDVMLMRFSSVWLFAASVQIGLYECTVVH